MAIARSSYFKKLTWSLIASFSFQFLVFVYTLDRQDLSAVVSAGLLVAVGLLPLVYYHFFVLKPLVLKGAGSAAVDSVYYFGFLVTLGSLAFGALGTSMSVGGNIDVERAVGQFALGLVATAYAIVARLHLLSIGGDSPESSPEETLDTVVSRSQLLLHHLETATGALRILSETTVEETSKIVKASQFALTGELRTITETFSEEMKSIFEDAKRGASETRSAVEEVRAITQRDSLTVGIERAKKHVDEFAVSMLQLHQNTSKGADATQGLTIAADDLAAKLRESTNGLVLLGANDGPLHEAGQRISVSARQIADGADAISSSMKSIGEVSESSSGVGKTLKTLKTIVSKADSSLERLAETMSKLDESCLVVQSLADSAGGLATGFTASATTLPQMTVAVASASSTLAQLEARSADASRALQQMVDLAGVGAGALDGLGVSAKSTTSDLAKYSSQLQNGGSAIDSAVGSMSEIGKIDAAVGQLAASLETLIGRLGVVESNLAKVSTSLDVGLLKAEQSLERNVVRAGEAATLFTERLTVVAKKVAENVNSGASR